MTRINHLSITFFCCALLVSSAVSQVLIDVKTRFNEKKELHFIKLALITSIDTSGWSRTTEVGEHFSLWLENFKHTSVGDSLRSECDLEFHTPAMISEGQFISSKHLSIVFDKTGLLAEPIPPDSLLSNMIVQNLLNSKMFDKLLKLLGASSSVVSGNPMIGYLIQTFVTKFVHEFSRRPSALETVEASLLGTKALFEVQSFVKQRYPQVIKR